MSKEAITIETVKTPEKQESHEAPKSVESPEEFRQQIICEAEKETADFKSECADDITKTEDRAEKEQLIFDSDDKNSLQEVIAKTDVAKTVLMEVVGDEHGLQEKLDKEKIAKIVRVGQEKIHALFSAGQQDSPEYEMLSSVLLKQENGSSAWKSIDEIDIAGIKEIMAKMKQEELPNNPESDTDDKEKAANNNIRHENVSAMKERAIENPELLSKKEASKKFLAEERQKLAEEIRTQRKLQRERLSVLKTAIENSINTTENIEAHQEDTRYARLAETQSVEANTIAERISSSALSEKDVFEEQENINQLIDNSEGIKSLKSKLEQHYAKADEISRKRFNTLSRSLEHVMKRNNAFIVHKIEERDEARHNTNSNVSSEATYQDDIDIVLALEPSISTSSVTPGEETKLWPGSSGLLLGGGQIGEAGTKDIGTVERGIKGRGGKAASLEEIDKVVGRQDKFSRQTYERIGYHGMNEVVVNNPEVFGFFQHAERDENGRFWADSVNETRPLSEEVPEIFGSGPDSYTNRFNLKSIVDRYRERFVVASKRGIPLYIMTKSREVYECLKVNDNGTIEVGKQITPEEVAMGRAGLDAKKRKEIGENLLEKKIFKKQETGEEAREIISSL